MDSSTDSRRHERRRASRPFWPSVVMAAVAIVLIVLLSGAVQFGGM